MNFYGMKAARLLLFGCALLMLTVSPGYTQTGDVFNSNSAPVSTPTLPGGTSTGSIPSGCSGPGGCPGSYYSNGPTGTQTTIPGNCPGCANTTGRTGTQAIQAPPLQGGVQQTAPLQGGVQQTAPLSGSAQQPAPLQGRVLQTAPPPGQTPPHNGSVAQPTLPPGQTLPHNGSVAQPALPPGQTLPHNGATVGGPPGHPNTNVGIPRAPGARVQPGGYGTYSPPAAHSGHGGVGLSNLPGILNALPSVAGAVNNILGGVFSQPSYQPPTAQYPGSAYPGGAYPGYYGGAPAYAAPPANYPRADSSAAYTPAPKKQASPCPQCGINNWKIQPKKSEVFKNVREESALAFGRYKTNYPFGIALATLHQPGKPDEEVCLVVASGFEKWQWSESKGGQEVGAAYLGMASNYELTIVDAIAQQCGSKKLILIGHSLAGMVLQHVKPYYPDQVLALVDLGSPRVIDQSASEPGYASFVVNGDIVPKAQFHNDEGTRILADDRGPQCFEKSDLKTALEVHHMYYPCDRVLEEYDVLGSKKNNGETGATLTLEHWHPYTVPSDWGDGQADSKHSF